MASILKFYYKNLRAKGLFLLSQLKDFKGHPEKSQLEEPWNSCGEMAAIWKGIVWADSAIKSLWSPINKSLFHFSHRGKYMALDVEFICFKNGFCLHLITLAHKMSCHLNSVTLSAGPNGNTGRAVWK